MHHPVNTLLRTCVLAMTAVGCSLAHSDTLPDRIFSSDFVEALVVQGYAGYPVPLANATVEIHFGANFNSARSASNGTFSVAVETDQLSSGMIVELIARGTGTQSSIVWASPLGPADRLLALAGASAPLTFAEEPFVHLNPRSTVAAAAIRAFNNNATVTDPTTFYRAARSRQYSTDLLVYGLAMIARGSASMPAGATDTFDAVTNIDYAQQIYAAAQQAINVDSGCTTIPLSAACEVTTTLPVDPDVAPVAALPDGVIHSNAAPFADFAFNNVGFRHSGTEVDVIGFSTTAIPADSSFDPDGSSRLTAQGGGPFSQYDDYPVIGGVQVREHVELTTLHVRGERGPGGQLEFATASDYLYTYPDNPGIPPVTALGQMSLPALSTGDSLPPSEIPQIPSLANGQFVFPTALPYTTYDGTTVYDIQSFGTANGEAVRFSTPFGFQQVAGATMFTIDFSGTHEDISFVNEEEAGVWRVSIHATGGAGESLVEGLFMAVDPAAGWTAVNTPGTYRSRINGQDCSGPYGDLELLTGSLPCFPIFGWVFADDGTVQDHLDPPAPYGTWRPGSGADSARLLLDRTNLTGRRGWQMIRQSADQIWVLENSNYSTDGTPLPPVTFTPTGRLVRLDRQ